jgi:hypothetical protein
MTHTARLFSLLAILCAAPGVLRCQSLPAETPGRTLSLQEYIAELDRASETLATNNSAQIHAYREQLPQEWSVQAEGERRVSTDWLGRALSAAERQPDTNEAVVEEARQRLVSLRSAAADLAQMPSAGATGRAKTQLEAILSAREFEKASGPSRLDLFKARIYDWIFRQLGRLFGGLGRAPVSSGVVLWVVVILAALLLAFWAARSLVGSKLRSPIDLSDAPSPAPDWRRWAWEAREAAERGDYRTAIHNAYWAGVCKLEAAKLLPEGRSRTPRESLRLIDRQSPAYEPLAVLTRSLELVWYGYRTATIAEWTDATRHLELLECL